MNTEVITMKLVPFKEVPIGSWVHYPVVGKTYFGQKGHCTGAQGYYYLDVGDKRIELYEDKLVCVVRTPKQYTLYGSSENVQRIIREFSKRAEGTLLIQQQIDLAVEINELIFQINPYDLNLECATAGTTPTALRLLRDALLKRALVARIVELKSDPIVMDVFRMVVFTRNWEKMDPEFVKIRSDLRLYLGTITA